MISLKTLSKIKQNYIRKPILHLMRFIKRNGDFESSDFQLYGNCIQLKKHVHIYNLVLN